MHAEGRGRVLINLDFMCFQLNSTKNFSLRHSNVCQVNCRLKKPPHHPLRFENHFLCQLEEYLSHFYENNVVRILRNNFEIMFGFSARRSLNLLLFLFFFVADVGQSLPFVAAAQLYKCLFRGISDELSFDCHSKLGLSLTPLHTHERCVHSI